VWLQIQTTIGIFQRRPAPPCPLWVVSGQTISRQNPAMSALDQKQTNAGSAKCHKRTFLFDTPCLLMHCTTGAETEPELIIAAGERVLRSGVFLSGLEPSGSRINNASWALNYRRRNLARSARWQWCPSLTTRRSGTMFSSATVAAPSF
jgi:hypothetical protein